MLANTNIFTDKETTNWFKACIALNVTKEGLSCFVETELQKIHTTVGRSCGKCSIEQLLPCPTHGMCNKRKGNTCIFHHSQQCQYCPTCDQVKQNIKLLHRFNGPSWRNTQAERWATHPWEIGKCFLPPDGYSGVSSVQESDINGVISIMLNCMHFQKCLSSSCLPPPPPDKQCLLEKVRQMGRNIRHTADCKVSDVDLLDYFKTLATLLVDPTCLVNDTSAKISKIKLDDLQNDRMSLSELGELLKEADRTLTRAKEAGERFSEAAERALTDCLEQLEASLQAGEQRIESKIEDGKQRIEDTIQDGNQRLDSKIHDGKQRIEDMIQAENQRLEVIIQDGEQRIESKIDDGKQRIENTIQDGNQRLEVKIKDEEQRFESKIEDGKQRIEDTIQDWHQHLEVKIQEGEQRMESKIDDGKQRIEDIIYDRKQYIEDKIQDGEQRIESKIDDGKQRLETTIQDVEQRLKVKIQDGAHRIIQTDREEADKEYTRGVEEILGALMIHYDRTLSHLPSSPLNDTFRARLDDVYMPPYVQLMKKDKGSFKRTNTQITKYKDVLNRQTFIQGEAGSGKTSFLAKLVMDWCSTTKTTRASEPLITKVTHNADPDTRARHSTCFDDLTTLTGYTFVFYIALRDSVKRFEILQMIKEQLIDAIYASKKDRHKAYRLVNEIMKNGHCLVLLDGLDEWTSPGDLYKIPTLVVSHTQSTLIITTRPWKLAEAKIPDSHIETLLQLEGVNRPFDVSLRILRCRDDCRNSKDLENKQFEFESYVYRNNLRDLLASPMFLTLIVQTWAEGTELKGSKCQIYFRFLETLFKKANGKKDHFQKPPFPCFKETQFIKPNIEQLNCFSEAAFHLLFSETRENSLVFGIEQLIQYNLVERKDFAMRTGILSATRKASTLRASLSFSFVHKSVQEFLAAVHIARFNHVIDEVISGYLKRHENTYLDISEVLIFLSGLNISAANKLSILMNNAACERPNSLKGFQEIILNCYREAVASEQEDIRLALSHFYIDDDNIRDLNNIWTINIPLVRLFSMELNIPTDLEDDCTESPSQDMQRSTASGEIASRIEFDMSSCDELTEINIKTASFGVWIKDSTSLTTSAFPNWIVLHSADSSPMLPSLERIELNGVTVCSTWLRKLFNTQLTLDYVVQCELEDCKIITSVGDTLSGSYPFIDAVITTDLNNTFEVIDYSGNFPGLWETLRGLKMKTLSLKANSHDWTLDYVSSLSQSLSSLKQLETLSIHVDAIPPELWSVLYSLSMKRVALSLKGEFNGLIVSHVGMLSQSVFSVSQIDSIYMDVNSPRDVLVALHGLNITSLNICGSGEHLEVTQVSLLLTLLLSLKQLENLSIDVKNDSPGLWQALHGMDIKCLNIGIRCRGFKVNHVPSLLMSLSSLKQLEMITFYVTDDIYVVSEILHSLTIKSLSLLQTILPRFDIMVTFTSSILMKASYSLNGRSVSLRLYFDIKRLVATQQSLFQLLSSLKELETLSIDMNQGGDGLWESLRCLKIKTLSLKGDGVGSDVQTISQSLKSLTQLETLSIEVGDYRPVKWASLLDVNIRTLNLKNTFTNISGDQNYSLLSLTHLEILNIHMTFYRNILLPQTLKYLNIFWEALTPLELRDVITKLSSCSQVVRSTLEFGCACVLDKSSFPSSHRRRIPPEEYLPIQQEINDLTSFTIKRFRILQRSPRSDKWSVCNIGNIDVDDHGDDSATNEMFKTFLDEMNYDIVNRISIRLQIIPASIVLYMRNTFTLNVSLVFNIAFDICFYMCLCSL